MRRNETLLELLLELQILDRVPRMGYVLRGVSDPESITEHSWHVAFLVWALGSRIPGLDLLRALEIALVHDLAEVRTGDLPRVAKRYFARGTQEAAEREVIDELLGPLGDRTAELMAEYRAAETAEARLVKACDKLQLMVKVAAYERWGAGWLAEFWDNPDNFPDPGFDVVRELFEELARTHGGRGAPPWPAPGSDSARASSEAPAPDRDGDPDPEEDPGRNPTGSRE